METRDNNQGSYVELESNDAIVSRLAKQDKVPWYKKPNLRYLYILTFPTCLGAEMAGGFDQSMTNALQAVPAWLEYFHHPRSALLGLVGAAYAIGAFFAAPFAPIVAEKFGRRHLILFGSIVTMVGGFLQGASVNLAMFVIARFISGFGVVFAVVAASSLVGELAHPKERPVLGSLMYPFYYIGGVAAAAVTLGTFAIPNNWAWRIPSFLQVAPSLIQLSFIYYLPESPRWLISKGRQDEAYSILAKYHAEGDVNSEFVKAEYTQIEQTLELELQNSQRSQKNMLSTPGMRKRIVIASFLAVFTPWSGIALISQFLPLILDSVGIHDHRTKNMINLVKFSWNLVNSTILALIVPWYPRRRMYLACTVSLFFVMTAFSIASAEYAHTHSTVATNIVIALIFVYSPAFNLGCTSLNATFLVELFPFHARVWGLSIFQLLTRGASFSILFLNPIALDALGWRWYACHCVWILLAVVFVYVMFPETSGRTLEELAFLYEDDHRQDKLINAEVEVPHYGATETHDTLRSSVVETVRIRRR